MMESSLKFDASGFSETDVKQLSTSKNYELVFKELTLSDYRSIYFLLINVKSVEHKESIEYPDLVKQSKDYLMTRLLKCYVNCNSFPRVFVEILFIMKKNKLLKMLETCQHEVMKNVENFGKVNPLWKSLFYVCEQLTDKDVQELQQKFLSDENVVCAEDLVYRIFLKCNRNIKELSKMFQKDKPECCNILDNTDINFNYKIREPTSKCGIAVIFANSDFKNSLQFERIERNESEAEQLQKLWQSFGFIAEVCKNYTDEEMINYYQDMAVDSRLKEHNDVFVACHLSHGTEGVVYGSNCKAVKINVLIDIMANRCHALKGKPKLFFIQACQGNLIQQGVGGATVHYGPNKCVESPMSRENGDKVPDVFNLEIVARYSDTLCAWSTIQGFVSVRGWFMQTLYEVMLDWGEHHTINVIMTEVSRIVSEKSGHAEGAPNVKQTSSFTSTLTRQLQLKKMR